MTPYGESKVLAEHDLRRARRRRLQPDVPAQRHRLRRLAAAARRPRRQQPRRLRRHDRRGAHQERRHALAAARPHRGHRARVPRRARGAARARARPGVQRRRDDGELPRSARSPRSSRRSCPAAACGFAEGAGPDMRNYRVNCDKLAATLPDVRAAVDRAPRRRGAATTRSSRTDLTLEDFEGAALPAHQARAASSRRRAASTSELRWLATAARASRRAGAVDGAADRSVPIVRQPRRCELVPRRSATCRCADALVRPDAARRPEPRYPARRRVLPRLLARPDPGGGAARAAVRRQLPLLLVVLGRACCAHSREHALRLDRRARARAGQPRRRGRRERRLSAAQLRRGRHPGARHRPGARPGGRGRARRACRPLREFFGADARPAAARRGPPRRRDRRQQRHGAHARPERLRRRAGDRCSRTTASRRSRTRTSRI